jgi:phage tail sheath protein FI
MGEKQAPGIYIEEPNTGPRPIQGVGTAVAAFVGRVAWRGDWGSKWGADPKLPKGPIAISSWTAYATYFQTQEDLGAAWSADYLGNAVYGWFQNGGRKCYIVPVGRLGASGAVEVSTAIGELAFIATPKANVKDLAVEVKETPGKDGNAASYTIRLSSGNKKEELVKDAPVGAGWLNEGAKALTLASIDSRDKAPQPGTAQSKVSVPATADFQGKAADRSGIAGLEVIDEVTMVACPSIWEPEVRKALEPDGVIAVQKALVEHCERLRDRMAILDCPPDVSDVGVTEWVTKKLNLPSAFAAFYYPWVKIASPDSAPVPPCGHIAGIWARSDGERGVHKAPANEIVRGAIGPESTITMAEQESLNPIGINCIRQFTGRGTLVWGARTLAAKADARWRYINVRRLFNYVEESIEEGTQWVVFEPNDRSLWAKVTRDITGFLTRVWRDGALFGATAEQAFYVKCDDELNPPEVRDAGQLIIEIGLAPVKPAEFIIIRFTQWVGGGA